MPIWDYNNTFYLKINDIKIKELHNEHTFQKDVPYIMDITFRNMTLKRKVSRLQVTVFPKLINLLSFYIYI